MDTKQNKLLEKSPSKRKNIKREIFFSFGKQCTFSHGYEKVPLPIAPLPQDK